MSNIEEIPILRNNVQNSIKWRREIVQREKSSFFKTIAMASRFEMRDKVNHCTFLCDTLRQLKLSTILHCLTYNYAVGCRNNPRRD